MVGFSIALRKPHALSDSCAFVLLIGVNRGLDSTAHTTLINAPSWKVVNEHRQHTRWTRECALGVENIDYLRAKYLPQVMSVDS